MNKQTEFVLSKIKSEKPKRLLNIGFRHDSDQTILNYCNENAISFDVIEIYKPNCEFLKNNRKIANIYNLDVANILTLNIKWEMIIWLHGPEHITFDKFKEIAPRIESCAPIVIYQAPEGEYPQGDIYGNIYERHVASLTEKMFKELGYNTNNFLKYGEPAFSARK